MFMQEIYDLWRTILDIPYGVIQQLRILLTETTYPLKIVIIIEYIVLAYFGIRAIFRFAEWAYQSIRRKKETDGLQH